MEIVTALFVVALYKATETIWDKAFSAAWEPVGESLKGRFFRWAGKDRESERKAAFDKAVQRAYDLTVRQAPNPQQVETILVVLNDKGADTLAEEAANLMLFSAAPDVHRLTVLVQEKLNWNTVWAGQPRETIPSPEVVAETLSYFLTNLREALLDQEPYHNLIQREMLVTLRKILVELRPTAYDDEATYRAQVAEVYRELGFVGIPELKERRPVTVEDIFIRLQAQPEGRPEDDSELLEFYQLAEELKTGNKEELAKLHERRNILVHQAAPKPSENIDATLRQTKQVVVLGDPGAGKTTLLKYLTVICAEGRAEAELDLKSETGEPLLPIFITLCDFAVEASEHKEQDYNLLDYLHTHAHERLLLNLPSGFFKEALEAGNCLVCLDGLDEVWAVGQRKMVTDAVKALATRFRRSRYIVTSRKVGYENAPLDRRDFVHHTILPLTDDDIRDFVRRWYAVRERDPIKRQESANNLIETIEREPRIQSLARNPLLLTIIALVHRIEAELPHERVKLYDKCVTALVDTWEEVKGLTLAEKQRPFYRYRRRLLEQLAYELHTKAEKPGEVQTVKEGDLEVLLTRFLMENRRLGFAEDPDGARDEAQAFIRLAQGRTGLLIERGEGVFAFPHLTFQEYLAACDIENRCIHRGVTAIWDEIKDHLHDPHWQEVILLLFGSLNKYDEPPTLLIEQVLEAGKTDKFEPVLHQHLYLASRILADKVAVDSTLHKQIIDELLTLARNCPPSSITHSALIIQLEGPPGDTIAALDQLKEDNYTLEGLLTLVRDDQVHFWVRVAIAWILGGLNGIDQRISNILTSVIDDIKHASDPEYLVPVLGRLAHKDNSALDALLALAQDPHVVDDVRLDAASALGELGQAERAAEFLLALAQDPHKSGWMYSAAVSALGQLGLAEPKALDALLALAQDPHVADNARLATASALGRLGQTKQAIELLLALAQDPHVADDVRRDAASALGRLGQAEPKVFDTLLALVQDSDAANHIRLAAVSAVGQLEQAEPKVLDTLLALVQDSNVAGGVRSAAAIALGQLEQAEPKVLDTLLALIQDLNMAGEVRSAAAVALGQLGQVEKAAELLLILAKDPNMTGGVRSVTTIALGRFGQAEPKVLDTLLALAQDLHATDWVRLAAAIALGQLGQAEPKVLDTLLALVQDPDITEWVRDIVYRVLKKLVTGVGEEYL